jgi:HEAT repeat protein
MRCSVFLAVGLLALLASAAVRADDEEREYNGKKLKQWIADLRDVDPGTRETALRTLPVFGKDARKATRNILAELRDSDTSLRVNAVILLGQIGLDSADMDDGVKAIGRLLSDPQQVVRLQAAVTLAFLGADAKAAIPQLEGAIRDSNNNSFDVRKAAAMALRTVAMDAKKGADSVAIRALTGALKDNCARVRLEALFSLVVLGKPAQTEWLQNEKHALQLRFRDSDKTVALWARVAWMRIEKVEELHLTFIGQMLKNPDAAVCIQAAQALGLIGPDARSQVPRLLEALDDKNDLVSLAAVNALMKMGSDADRALPALTKMAEGTNEVRKQVAQVALDAISKQGPKPKDAPKKNDAP